jgi:PPOX class probable F420-dependent enzyme
VRSGRNIDLVAAVWAGHRVHAGARYQLKANDTGGWRRWLALMPGTLSVGGVDSTVVRVSVDLIPAVRRRLGSDLIAWLTTVRGDGTPVSRPVWFVWEQPDLLVYSAASAHKVRHLLDRPRASFHLNTDQEGGGVVVFDVEGSVEPSAAPPSQCPGYLGKYQARIAGFGLSVAAYDDIFPTLLRLRVLRQAPTGDTLG